MKILLKTFLFISIINISFAQISTTDNSNLFLSTSTLNVSIGGSFLVTGSFSALITERVDAFVTRIYTEAKEKSLRITNDPEELLKLKKELENYSLRNITLKRVNGEVLKLDLLKFRVNGDFINNPYLKNDDVLLFEPMDLETNYFSISGAVNKPGKYPFVDGDKISDAIELALGLNKAYDKVLRYEIRRLSYDGTELQKIDTGLNADYALQRGDRIVILTDETQRRDFNVLVLGEVNSPGLIPINKTGLPLRQIIEEAGGLTNSASLNGAKIFTGNSITFLMQKLYGFKTEDYYTENQQKIFNALVDLQSKMMIRMSNLTEVDTTYFYLEDELRVLTESAAIDFNKVYEEGSPESHYIVKDGDVIFIPQQDHNVYVYGQVPHPGKIPFVPDADYQSYIEKAGGFGEYADDEVMLIKAHSREWLPITENEYKIEEGDFIYVPRIPIHSFNYYVSRFGTYLGIVASAATIVLLLIQFGK